MPPDAGTSVDGLSLAARALSPEIQQPGLPPPSIPSPPAPASLPSVRGAGDQPYTRSGAFSTTFSARLGSDNVPADVILLSSDDVLFYVHRDILQGVSENAFGGLLPLSSAQHSAPPNQHSSPQRVPMSERAEVAEIMLYTIYALPFVFTPQSLTTLVEACTGLRKYGVPSAHSLSPTSPLYAAILAFAETRSMEAYALAAESDAFALASACSAHLISFNLVRIDDQLVERLGPIYLTKLFMLHTTRLEALKGLLRYTPRPRPHPQTSSCTNADQQKLESGWMLGAASLIWQKRIDRNVDGMRATLESLGQHLSCEICIEALSEVIKDFVHGWSEVPCTIR